MRKRQVMTEGARACASPGGSIPATPPRQPPKAGTQHPPARAPEGSWPSPGSLPLGLGGRQQEGRGEAKRKECMHGVCVRVVCTHMCAQG